MGSPFGNMKVDLDIGQHNRFPTNDPNWPVKDSHPNLSYGVPNRDQAGYPMWGEAAWLGRGRPAMLSQPGLQAHRSPMSGPEPANTSLADSTANMNQSLQDGWRMQDTGQGEMPSEHGLPPLPGAGRELQSSWQDKPGAAGAMHGWLGAEVMSQQQSQSLQGRLLGSNWPSNNISAQPFLGQMGSMTAMGTNGLQNSIPKIEEALSESSLHPRREEALSAGEVSSGTEEGGKRVTPDTNSISTDQAGWRKPASHKYTPKQQHRLELYYQKVPQPDKDYRAVIADDCGLSYDAVTAWFNSKPPKEKRKGEPETSSQCRGRGRPKKKPVAPNNPTESSPKDERLLERQTGIVNLIAVGDVPRTKTLLYGPQYGPATHGLVLDSEGHTAVHWAAALGQLPMLTMLLQQGENVSAVNAKGETPLHRAVMWNFSWDLKVFPEVLRLLMSNLPIVNKRGQTCLHVACHNLMLGSDDPKRQAAEAYIPLLVAESSLDINHQDEEGNTALGYAVEFANAKITKLLLEAKANCNLRNAQGLSVMDCPNSKNNRQIRRVLAEHFGLPLEDSPVKASSSPYVQSPTAGGKSRPKGIKRRFRGGELKGSLDEASATTPEEGKRRRTLDGVLCEMEQELQQAQQSVQLLQAELREKKDRLTALLDDNRILHVAVKKAGQVL